MLKLHIWPTPNGKKIFIMAEELALPYDIHWINIGKDEQFAPEFLAISPNNKIPAIVDEDADGGPLSIFESGAILTYLAEKHGRFLAPSGPARYKALEWLHWQIGGWGPMLGQLGFFAVRSDEKAPLAIKRFTEEAERLLRVLDTRLQAAPYLAGNEYTIADMATYTWAVAADTFLKPVLGEAIAGKQAFRRWLDDVGARPAVAKAMAIQPPQSA